MSKVETPCDWCVNEEGMHFCPFSDDPTSDMCSRCEEERRYNDKED